MGMMFFIRFKELCRYRLLIILMLVLPAVFGYLESYAFADKKTPLSVAYMDNDETDLSKEFLDILSKTSGIRLLEAADSKSGEKLLYNRKAEGLLTVNKGFSEEVLAKAEDLVDYVSAPGTSSAELVSECVSLAVVHIRSQNMITEAVCKLDPDAGEKVREVYKSYAVAEPILTVKEYGDMNPAAQLILSPKHGLISIFVLLSGLFAVFKTGEAEETRVRLCGKKAYLKDYVVSAGVIALAWLAFAAVYLAFSALAYGDLPDASTLCAFVVLTVLSLGIGMFASSILRDRRSAVYLYIPFLFINMTAGGALWGKATTIAALAGVIPSSLFSSAAKGDIVSAAVMLCSGIMLLIISYFAAVRKRT